MAVPVRPGLAPALGYGAAHKPGAVPLRPLRIGDILDAAFKVIRFNPKATVGGAVLLSSLAMVLPLLVSTATLPTLGAALEGDNLADSEITALVALVGSVFIGVVLQSIGLILSTGMVAHVTMAAALGRRMSLGQAWSATRGSRWKLILLSLAMGVATSLVLGIYVAVWILAVVAGASVWFYVIWGVVTIPALLVLLLWMWIRLYYLAVPALMLEQVTIFGSISRALSLSHRGALRIFGIALLTAILTQVAGSLLSFPVTLLGQVPVLMGASLSAQTMALVITQALSVILAAAFTTPFSGAVAALLYIDQRIRKEAFDVDLMTRAGIPAP